MTLSSWPACSPPPGVNVWEKLPPPNFPSEEAQAAPYRLGELVGPSLRQRPATRAHTDAGQLGSQH